MVRVVNKASVRSAFTMIELVFAIVIISITMLSIPMVMRVNATNQEDALMQEGILITSSKISQALTYPWDTNSSPGGIALMSLSNVVDTDSGVADLNRTAANSDFRVGHFQENLRRRLTPNSAPRIASAIVANDNSIAHQHDQTENLGIGGQYSYKKDWSVTSTVTYIPDNATYGTATGIINDFDYNLTALPAGTTSNIKMIQVIATDNTVGGSGDSIQLTSFSSNIGETEFYKRRY